MSKELIVVAGFLGAGKTTLLRNLIEAHRDKKVAVLINDFGEVPVDAALISSESDGSITVSEITGGSIFCSCRQDSFLKALMRLADMDVDTIVVEASGYSDPTLIAKLLAQSGLDARLTLRHTLCLFDPVKSYKLSHVLEVIQHQVAAADVILLTKSDITSKEDRDKARNYISAINKDAPVLEIGQGMVDFAALPCRRPDRGIEESNFRPGVGRPGNFTVAGPVRDLTALLTALQEDSSVLRVKGFIRTPEGPVYVSDTGQGFEVAPSKDAPVPLNILCAAGKAEFLEASLRARHLL